MDSTLLGDRTLKFTFTRIGPILRGAHTRRLRN